MANFVKLEATQTSTILESIESEREFLFEQSFALFRALLCGFGLLLASRYCLAFFYFGAFPVFDILVPISIAFATFLFLATFALTATISFVIVLLFSSCLGMSVSANAVRSVFCGLTAFPLVTIWHPYISSFFFCGLLPSPFATYVVTFSAMLVACLYQPNSGLTIRKANPLRIKHLLMLTALFAVFLATVQLLSEDYVTRQIFNNLPIYVAAQIVATCCSKLCRSAAVRRLCCGR